MLEDATNVEWIVTHHLGTELQVEYTYYGKKCSARITVPGADGRLSEEIVRTAIQNEVQAAIRKHKYIGLTGAFKEVRKDGNDSKD
ncbi:MAG: hypothetical protein PHY48_15335 [Candidatus Cloacimonetes bacterium]|nr:hypothetical protein [Candidatus Cloacimonadota bacterium]